RKNTVTLLKHGLLIMNNDRRQIEIRTPTASGRRVRTLKSVQLVPNVHAPRFQLVHRSQNLRIKQTHLVGNKRSSGKEGLNQWRFNFHINTYRTNRQYPRPQALIDGVLSFRLGRIKQQEFDLLCNSAVRDTIRLFEATGSPVITHGDRPNPVSPPTLLM